MNSLLDIVLFIAIVALLYLVLLSRYGLFARLVRKRQNRHDRAVREMAPYSESKYRPSNSRDDNLSDSPPRTSKR